MKKTFILTLVCILVLTLTACTGNSGASNDTPPNPQLRPENISAAFSSFSTTDLNGNALDQSVLADHKLTMVNVWATFCGPCIDEMPDLGELADEYKDQGFQMVGMVTDVLNSNLSLSERQLKTAREIVTATNADYLHFVPSGNLIDLLFQITAVPTTFFVDEDGNNVGEIYVGNRDKAGWAEIIEQTLSEI